MSKRRYPASETALIGAEPDGSVSFVCGIPVKAGGEPVSLRSQHQPGFGLVEFTRNGRVVDSDMHDDDRTLQWYENRAAKNPRARWEVIVHGPMTGYVMRRIRGQWYVTESLDGFA